MAIAFVTLCALTIPAACIYLYVVSPPASPKVDRVLLNAGHKVYWDCHFGRSYWCDLSVADQQACQYYKENR